MLSSLLTAVGIGCYLVGFLGLLAVGVVLLSRVLPKPPSEDPAAKWRGTGWRCGWRWEWDAGDLPWPPSPGQRILADLPADAEVGYLIPTSWSAAIADMSAREEAAFLGLKPAWQGF